MNEVITREPTGPPTNLPQQAVSLAAFFAAPRPELAKALAKAVLACHGAVKAKENTYHHYKYASSEAIIEEGRAALAHAGLSLLPVEAALVGSEREGADRYELLRTFLLLHESGESAPLRVAWPVVVEKGRPLDKATAAADTLSLAYLLRDLLLMPRVSEDADVAARDDRQYRPKQAQPAAKPQQRPRSQDAAVAAFAADLARAENGLVAALLAERGEPEKFVLGHLKIDALSALTGDDVPEARGVLEGFVRERLRGGVRSEMRRTDLTWEDADRLLGLAEGTASERKADNRQLKDLYDALLAIPTSDAVEQAVGA